jgi:hypothetical protein
VYFQRDPSEATMRRSMLIAVAVVPLLSAPLAAARTEAVSWGKPGVSIDQYRTDAVTCGRLGYYADVSNTEAAHVFKDATGQLTANEAALSTTAMMAGSGSPEARRAAMMDLNNIVDRSAHIVESARPTERMKAVGNLLQAKVDDCLRARGYVRFRLTPQQRRHLAHLHLGSPARHAYLYSLATDPRVLQAQAMQP